MQKIIIAIVAICCALCSNSQPADTTKKIITIGVEWTLSDKVDSRYKLMIDSVFQSVMNEYNKEPETVILRKKTGGEDGSISFTFKKGKIVSNGTRTAGYIVSGLGLLAAPAITLAASGGNAVLAFWFFPRDRIIMTRSIESPSGRRRIRYAKRVNLYKGALFASKSERMKDMAEKLDDSIFKAFTKFEDD